MTFPIKIVYAIPEGRSDLEFDYNKLVDQDDLTINQFLSTLQLRENEAVYYNAKPLITLPIHIPLHQDDGGAQSTTINVHNNTNVNGSILVKNILSDLYESNQLSDSLELFVHDKSSTEAGRRAIENLVKFSHMTTAISKALEKTIPNTFPNRREIHPDERDTIVKNAHNLNNQRAALFNRDSSFPTYNSWLALRKNASSNVLIEDASRRDRPSTKTSKSQPPSNEQMKQNMIELMEILQLSAASAASGTGGKNNTASTVPTQAVLKEDKTESVAKPREFTFSSFWKSQPQPPELPGTLANTPERGEDATGNAEANVEPNPASDDDDDDDDEEADMIVDEAGALAEAEAELDRLEQNLWLTFRVVTCAVLIGIQLPRQTLSYWIKAAVVVLVVAVMEVFFNTVINRIFGKMKVYLVARIPLLTMFVNLNAQQVQLVEEIRRQRGQQPPNQVLPQQPQLQLQPNQPAGQVPLVPGAAVNVDANILVAPVGVRAPAIVVRPPPASPTSDANLALLTRMKIPLPTSSIERARLRVGDLGRLALPPRSFLEKGIRMISAFLASFVRPSWEPPKILVIHNPEQIQRWIEKRNTEQTDASLNLGVGIENQSENENTQPQQA